MAKAALGRKVPACHEAKYSEHSTIPLGKDGNMPSPLRIGMRSVCLDEVNTAMPAPSISCAEETGDAGVGHDDVRITLERVEIMPRKAFPCFRGHEHRSRLAGQRVSGFLGEWLLPIGRDVNRHH